MRVTNRTTRFVEVPDVSAQKLTDVTRERHVTTYLVCVISPTGGNDIYKRILSKYDLEIRFVRGCGGGHKLGDRTEKKPKT